MRGLQLALRPWHAARLNGRKTKGAVLCGGNAAVAPEARLRAFRLRVFRMGVFALRICLPKFEHRVGNTFSIGVEYSSLDLNPFAGDAWACDIVHKKPFEADEKKRANRL